MRAVLQSREQSVARLGHVFRTPLGNTAAIFRFSLTGDPNSGGVFSDTLAPASTGTSVTGKIRSARARVLHRNLKIVFPYKAALLNGSTSPARAAQNRSTVPASFTTLA